MANEDPVDPFSNVVPADVEHAVHECLPFGEVVALQCVSRTWRVRIGAALRQHFTWDVRHCERSDMTTPHEWLEHVARARVRVRTLHLDTPAVVIRTASFAGLANVVELLVRHYASKVNAADRYGATPLHQAAWNGHRDVVEVLLAVPNIKVIARDEDGLTPLHHALLNGHRDLAEALLAAQSTFTSTAINADRDRATFEGPSRRHRSASCRDGATFEGPPRRSRSASYGTECQSEPRGALRRDADADCRCSWPSRCDRGSACRRI